MPDDDGALGIPFNPPAPDVVWERCLETCRCAGVEPVSRERARSSQRKGSMLKLPRRRSMARSSAPSFAPPSRLPAVLRVAVRAETGDHACCHAIERSRRPACCVPPSTIPSSDAFVYPAAGVRRLTTRAPWVFDRERGWNPARHPAHQRVDSLAVLEAGQAAGDDGARRGQFGETLAHLRDRHAGLLGEFRVESLTVFREAMQDLRQGEHLWCGCAF